MKNTKFEQPYTTATNAWTKKWPLRGPTVGGIIRGQILNHFENNNGMNNDVFLSRYTDNLKQNNLICIVL